LYFRDIVANDTPIAIIRMHVFARMRPDCCVAPLPTVQDMQIARRGSVEILEALFPRNEEEKE
jgi:hypothetical protein